MSNFFESNNSVTKEFYSNREDKCLKILAVGNSFSDDTMEYVGYIANSLGINVVLGNLYIGGCDITTHLNCLKNYTPAYEYRVFKGEGWVTSPSSRSVDAILSEDWDYISFQQCSAWSGKSLSYTDLDELLAAVKSLVPKKTSFVWNMTWAYQQDFENPNFAAYASDQATMYSAIINTVHNVICNKNEFDIIVPTGTAVQNARTTFLGDTLTRDGFHLNLVYGRYIAGLTYLCAITGLSPNDVAYAPEGVPKNSSLFEACQESALNAIKIPFAVTKSNLQ